MAEVMGEADVAKTAVWRWQERFMQEDVDELPRDKTRPSRIPPLGLYIDPPAHAVMLSIASVQ